jgi:hypothetical protein
MEVKYSSYTEAQKRATKKYRQSNKDKVNEQNKKYYSNKKEGDENFLLMKNLKGKLTYQVRKLNKLVIDGKITQFEYDDKYTNLLHKYNSDLADLQPRDEPTPPSPTDEPTESEYSISSSDESKTPESSSNESSLYTSTDESSSDESKTSLDSDESNKPYVEEAECLETRTPALIKPTKKTRKPRTKKVVEPVLTESTTTKKRTRNKKFKQDLNPPIIMEFEQNSINARFDQPI